MRIIKLTIFIVVFFFCVEFYLKYKKPTPYLYDSELGCTLKKDFKYTYKEKDLYNNQYSSFYSTNSFGARSFIQKGYLNQINQSLIQSIKAKYNMDDAKVLAVSEAGKASIINSLKNFVICLIYQESKN